MDTSLFIKHIKAQPEYCEQLVHLEHIPSREALYAETENPLNPDIEATLKKKRIYPLYLHQTQAIDSVRRGENVMVVTPSASGKSLCYNIPVIEEIIADPSARALYLFPTKALAQDQLSKLHYMFSPQFIDKEKAVTFDGDTPQAERAEIKKQARIVLTNPDMLHVGILPNHEDWLRFLRNLKFVIIDEAHSYRGVFGSHVALVLRRLRRICNKYEANPQFICCSATVDNPCEHIENLVGVPFNIVNEDGAPHGPKDFAFWNPPLTDPLKGIRRSSNSEATNLFTELVRHNIRTLTFARTRRLTELIFKYSKQKLDELSPHHSQRIKPYRAGYLPEQRRQIERELLNGQLMGVVATNALELGIDIGDLDATVLTGYPSTIASTWQQAGRSGRGGQLSLSFLVGLDNPLDQYFMRNPDAFFKKSFENALINPQNHYILRDHLLCAAWELPLKLSDNYYFGSTFSEALAELESCGLMRQRHSRRYLSPSINYPAQGVNIRSASADSFILIDTQTNSVLETVEAGLAIMQVHPGAIYLHQGNPYLVTSLDIEAGIAKCEPTNSDYYTVTKDLTDLTVLKKLKEKKCGNIDVCLGEVEVITVVTGFKKKAQYSEEILGEEPLDLPPQRLRTIALWFDITSAELEVLEKEGLDPAGGLHAVEHAAIGILPLFAMCDRNDIGGVSTINHIDTGKAQVFIYDAYPGGVGISEKGYDLITDLWQATFNVVNNCPCQDGCPACIQSPKCGNNNNPLDKNAALHILKDLL
ncbi:MAG: DEAD/DEAH box helicase [Dehalococcoidales bacterium]